MIIKWLMRKIAIRKFKKTTMKLTKAFEKLSNSMQFTTLYFKNLNAYGLGRRCGKTELAFEEFKKQMECEKNG